jgi:hypothetical protein
VKGTPLPYYVPCDNPHCVGLHVEVVYRHLGRGRSVLHGAKGTACATESGTLLTTMVAKSDTPPYAFIRWHDDGKRNNQHHGDYPMDEFLLPVPRFSTVEEAEAWLSL